MADWNWLGGGNCQSGACCFSSTLHSTPPPRPPTHQHGADAEAPVDDELAEGGRALVAVAAMHHEQAAEVPELSDGDVGGQ